MNPQVLPLAFTRLPELALGFRQTLSSRGDYTRRHEPRTLPEIARALSRWENEGGAVSVDDARLTDSYVALS